MHGKMIREDLRTGSSRAACICIPWYGSRDQLYSGRDKKFTGEERDSSGAQTAQDSGQELALQPRVGTERGGRGGEGVRSL